MTEPTPILDRAAIEDSFRRLGERLARRGVVADCAAIFPDEEVPSRARLVLDDVFRAGSAT